MTYKKLRNYFLTALSATAVFCSLMTGSSSMAQEEEEETYSINLVQTAEVSKEIIELGDKKILTETYVTKKGDHIWKILRNKEVLKKNKFGEVLNVLKELNHSLSNIDLIHPGEKIIIPLVITPITGKEYTGTEKEEEIETTSLEEVENLEYYTVKRGDRLIKVINEKYDIPGEQLYDEYLDQLKKINPGLKDINNIYPGQKVRLPIYSPKVARGTIGKPPQKSDQENEKKRLLNMEKGNHLGNIFTLIGEEWIRQGKHFIPLKSGGQIDLDTVTYPIINLRNGGRVIVDLFNGLPDNMADLIKSNWDNYHIVHIKDDDSLRAAVSKTLSACGYDRIYRKDESLYFEDGIKIEVNADWIVRLMPEPAEIDGNIVCLNLVDENSGVIPDFLKEFFTSHGVKIIDYPQAPADEQETEPEASITELENKKSSIIEKMLELTGQTYSARKDLKIYQGEDSGFNLVVKADYFFNRNGRDCIIDLKGLGEEITKLLTDQSYNILSIPAEETSNETIIKTLEFLDIAYDDKDHTFYAAEGNRKEDVKFIIKGVLFKDYKGRTDFISPAPLDINISRFLSRKTDQILVIDSPTAKEAE